MITDRSKSINILPAISMAKIYTAIYHFKAGPIGVCTGVSLLIGTLIGELSAGKLSDYIMYRLAKKNNGVRTPEHRLYLTSLAAVFMPVGMIIFGWCIQNKTHFVAPLVGLAIGKLATALAIEKTQYTKTFQAVWVCKLHRPAYTHTSVTATSRRLQRAVCCSTWLAASPSLLASLPCRLQPRLAMDGLGQRSPSSYLHSGSQFCCS